MSEHERPYAEFADSRPEPEGDEAQAAPQAPPSVTVESLQADLAAARDKYLRAAAELENYRKLVIREKADLMRSTQEGVLRALLPIVDSLERALRATGEGSQFAQAVQEGVELTYRQLQEVLKRLGVVPIESRGRAFDPSLHQAVERLELAGHDDNVVLEELQRGYLFHDRVLRPAMVSVAAKQSERETPAEKGGTVHG